MAENPKQEPKKEKSEFLKREEVRTMEKDIAKLRKEEAEQERQRITDISKGEPKEKKSKEEQELRGSLMPEEKEVKLEIAKPSSFQKVSIRLLIGAIVLLLLGTLAAAGYWFFVREEEQPPPEPAQEEEVVAEEPEETGTTLEIQERLISWGSSVPEEARSIELLVLHSAAAPDGEDPYSVDLLLEALQDSSAAYHYLVGREGSVWRLVPDENIAAHAEESANATSIGIGLVYQQTESPSREQYLALARLVSMLQELYRLGEGSAVPYSELNPGRNTPWNFSPERLQDILTGQES